MVTALLIIIGAVLLALLSDRFGVEQRPGFTPRRPQRPGERWSIV